MVFIGLVISLEKNMVVNIHLKSFDHYRSLKCFEILSINHASSESFAFFNDIVIFCVWLCLTFTNMIRWLAALREVFALSASALSSNPPILPHQHRGYLSKMQIWSYTFPLGYHHFTLRPVSSIWSSRLFIFQFKSFRDSWTLYWGRQWQPIPVRLPGKSHGWRSPVSCHLWGRTESDTTEVT